MSKRKTVLPKHMKRTIDRIEELSSTVDLVLEVVDARAPEATKCRILSKILSASWQVKVFSKKDLADPDITAGWERYYRENNTSCTSLPFGKKISAETFVRSLGLPEGLTGEGRMLKALVIGIPNVGKSTLTNLLVGHKTAHTGAKPGITRGVQLVKITEGFFLFDTPGVINPTIRSEEHACILGLAGCLQDSFYDIEAAAYYLIKQLGDSGLDRIEKTYDFKAHRDADETGILEDISKRRGFLLRGGTPDISRACRVLVTDFQTGRLKGISLEKPPD